MGLVTGRGWRALRESLGELAGDGRGWVLAVVAGGWFLSIGVRMVYPAVLPHLRGAFDLSLTAAGLLLTTLWVVYAVGQFPGGVLSDRFGSGRVLVVSTGATAVAVVGVVVSPSAGVLFVATGVLGLCTALFGPARFPLLSAVFGDRDGTAIGITQATGNLGNATLPLVAGVVASAVAWQLGFAFIVPLFLLVTVGLWWVVPREPEGASTVVRGSFARFARGLYRDVTTRSVLVMAGIQVLGSSMYQGFTGFYPTYLVEVKGLTPGVAAGLFGLFFAMGLVVQPVTGIAGDRFGEKHVLAVVLTLSTVALAVLPFVTGFWGLVGITIVLSIILGRGVLTLTYLTNVLSPDTRGTGLGFLRSVYITIGAMSPVVIGVMADAGYFDEAYLLLAGAGGVMLLLLAVLPARRR